MWGQCTALVVPILYPDPDGYTEWYATAYSSAILKWSAVFPNFRGVIPTNQKLDGPKNLPPGALQAAYPSAVQLSAGQGRIASFSYFGVGSGGNISTPFTLPSVHGYHFSFSGTNSLFTSISNIVGGPTNLLAIQTNGVEVGTLTNGQGYSFTNLQISGVDQFDVFWEGTLADAVGNPLNLTVSLGYSDTNANVNLTLFSKPGPLLVIEPTGATIPQGADLNLAVTALSDDLIQCQWQLNGTNLTDGTNTFLALHSTQPSASGDYRVILTDSTGSVTSSVAQVVVAPGSLIPPQFVFSAQQITTNGFQVEVRLEPGKAYHLQASANLTNWNSLTNFIAASNTFGFLDPMTNSSRFYRVTSP
jgi:hypothetical protein